MAKVITKNKNFLSHPIRKYTNLLGKIHRIFKSTARSTIFSLSSALHQWTYQNASVVGTTMTVLDTGSVGGLNLSNTSAAAIPTLNSDGISFATGDSVENSVSDFRIGDSTGVFHLYVKLTNTASNAFPFSSTDSGAANDQFYLQRRSDDTLQFLLKIGGTFYFTRTSTTLDYNFHVISFSQTGSRIDIWIDGVKASINASFDTAGTRWFNSVPNRTNISISPEGGEVKGEFYCPYVNDATVTSEVTEILNSSL